MRVHAVVLAAGTGRRYGRAAPKQLADLGGRTVLERAIDAVAVAGPATIVVVTSATTRPTVEQLDLGVRGRQIRIVDGGETRQASARRGLMSIEADPDDIILIHDAARPLVGERQVRGVIDAVSSGASDGAAPMLPLPDTIAFVDGPRIVEVPSRLGLRRLQTPQAFRAGVILGAHAAAEAAGETDASDDIGLVLRHVPGVRIVGVPGDEANLKITTPVDHLVASALFVAADAGHHQPARKRRAQPA
ncbi:MAG TPA: IspD/TarI family cytidylyltransferase [Candidatus Limnocylindrales bacterium]|nr:IspD/TarI family cytidylyltransferase [Candidatus Limnocylindrales bacterium]